MDQVYDAIIIGAGVAGLTCAGELDRNGFSYLVLDSSDGVGGRVRSDIVDGFTLDRGFQVLLTAYPEVARTLDYRKLDLRPFEPGAWIASDDRSYRLNDPFKAPASMLSMMFSDVASTADKLKVAYLRQKVMGMTINQIFNQPDKTILNTLSDEYELSSVFINRFFRPFFGGITIDKTLSGSRRMFDFVYKMMAEGQVVVPARGMGEISKQLAARLKEDCIRLSSKVETINFEKSQVTLASGQSFQGRAIVVATDGPSAVKLLQGKIEKVKSRRAIYLYFASETAPLNDPLLALNGTGNGPVNNLAVLSKVAPEYAPEGQHLISITCLMDGDDSDEPASLNGAEEAKLISTVLAQMKKWFGESVDGWRHLKTYVIEHALPDQTPPWLTPPSRPVQIDLPATYVCGDHRENASINGAMVSGRKAAEALTADLRVSTQVQT
jgi:phytoene dehydrogenase-like protein